MKNRKKPNPTYDVSQLKSPEIKLAYQEMTQKVNYLTLNAAMRDALVKTVPEVMKHKGIQLYLVSKKMLTASHMKIRASDFPVH